MFDWVLNTPLYIIVIHWHVSFFLQKLFSKDSDSIISKETPPHRVKQKLNSIKTVFQKILNLVALSDVLERKIVWFTFFSTLES